jgi:membrane protein DedA with SNARE-associated domain
VPELSQFSFMFGCFGALVLAGIGAPIPEELPTVALGIWVGQTDTVETLGLFRWLALPVALTGVILSDITLYWIGRLWGRKLLQLRWVAKLAPEEKRQKIEKNFQKYGVKILLFIRWVPAIRSPMFITAGVSRLPFLQFLAADAIAAAVGHSLLFFLAWWFGDTFQHLVKDFTRLEEKIKPLIIIGVIVAIGLYFLIHFYRRPFSVGDPHEVPLIGGHMAAKLSDPAAPAVPPEIQAKQADPAPGGDQAVPPLNVQETGNPAE